VRDADYEKYLGPGYDKSGEASTIVAPHTGFVDILLLLNMLEGNLSFATMDSLENAPAMGLLCKSLQCMFMPRTASQEIRDKVVEMIGERQRLVEEEEGFAPMVVFAEGTTQNNKYLMKFKKGAFVSMRSVAPCVFHFDLSKATIHPFMDVISGGAIGVMMCCAF
jgi:1-acyl-sn-glycerol-3-phosphate acyltransferase